MLIIKNLSFSFTDDSGREKLLFSNLNLSLQTGEIGFILGENGAGKSTLFNLISGQLKPTKGLILIDGVVISSANNTLKSKLVAKVLQNPSQGTFEELTIFENLILASKRGLFRGLSMFDSQQMRSFFKNKLTELGFDLSNRLDELASNLSGGQKQALSLLMALSAECKILLLDEVTAALDPKARTRIMCFIIDYLKKSQKTALIITHNLETINYNCRQLRIVNKIIETQAHVGQK